MKTTLITMPVPKPRNPLVAPSLRRKAGVHGERSARSARRSGALALKRELQSFDAGPRKPSP